MAKPGQAGGCNLNMRAKLSVNSDLVLENSSMMKLRIQVNFNLSTSYICQASSENYFVLKFYVFKSVAVQEFQV